jgi:glycosyltransferase involved in cell wall biosynthesis
MKILLVVNTRNGGGTEQHVASIAKALNLDVAYLDEDGLLGVWRKAQGADVVHFFLWRSYVLGSLVCRGPRIMSRRSLRFCYQTLLIRLVEKFLHRHTRVLVGNSPAVVEELRQEAPKADIRLIRSGITIEPKPHVPSGTFRMLCVANVWPYKGHPDLLEAMRLVAPKLPEPWQLTLAGRNTDKLRWLACSRPGLSYRLQAAVGECRPVHPAPAMRKGRAMPC